MIPSTLEDKYNSLNHQHAEFAVVGGTLSLLKSNRTYI